MFVRNKELWPNVFVLKTIYLFFSISTLTNFFEGLLIFFICYISLR